MKHIFIINPAAGKYDRTEEFSGKIAAACASRGLDYEVHVSEKPGDCRATARRAAESGEEVRLYACGGDGTLNEVVNGAAGFAAVPVSMVLSLVFARFFHWYCQSDSYQSFLVPLLQ